MGSKYKNIFSIKKKQKIKQKLQKENKIQAFSFLSFKMVWFSSLLCFVKEFSLHHIE